MLKIFTFILLLLTDQLTKYLALNEKLLPLGNILNHTNCNPYISWSIPLHGIFLWIFIFLAFSFLIYILKQNNFSYPLLLITAGALGNIIDRIHLNCIIDFISITLPFSIPLIGKTFPTFNLADTFITLGVILFLWKEFKNRK